MTPTLTPACAEEAAELILSGGPFAIRGLGTKREFGCPVPNGVGTAGTVSIASTLRVLRQQRQQSVLSTLGMAGIIEWSPDDLVVVVRAGTRVDELQAELSTKGQCLPIPPAATGLDALTAGLPGTVGGLVSAALPTRWDSWSKGVRYWVLGMTLVRGDGAVVRCGSKAVKNVAGYDAQKLFTGAWGTLGLVADVTFRVFPLSFGEHASAEPLESGSGAEAWNGAAPLMIARAPIAEASSFAQELGHDRWIVDRETGTVWAGVGGSERPKPPEHGWATFAGIGDANFPDLGPNLDLMRALKGRLDPQGKFNPGMMGAF